MDFCPPTPEFLADLDPHPSLCHTYPFCCKLALEIKEFSNSAIPGYKMSPFMNVIN